MDHVVFLWTATMRFSQITNFENVLWFYFFSGHIYGWGENTYGQASPQYTLSVCSMPKLISLPTGETATDISAISYGSFVLTDIGTVYIYLDSKHLLSTLK